MMWKSSKKHAIVFVLGWALPGYVHCRLQLKRGLFWYRLYPKLDQMVKYGSSRALRCASFLIRKNEGNGYMVQKNTQMLIFVTENL